MTQLERLIEALQIIQKYDPDTYIAAAHDQFWAGNYTKIQEIGSPEDLKRLDELGWFDDGTESYSRWM